MLRTVKLGGVAFLMFLVSCGTDKTTTDQDTPIVENLPEAEEVPSYPDYETIEDYALIFNRTELYETYGEENLKDDTVWYAEGTIQLSRSTLTDPSNGNIVHFIWEEEDNETFYMVEIFHEIYDDNYEVIARQDIASDCGYYLGMSLQDFREWNGQEFRFSGFDWDYAGGVYVDPGSEKSKCPVGITLSYEDGTDFNMMPMMGDLELSSDDEVVQGAPIFINHMFSYGK